jgi:transcriptional regulator of acetoin/glycerol metabolism
VLIQGTGAFVSDMLAAVRRDLRQPQFVWPDVPTAFDTRSATVVVPEVAVLAVDARDTLADSIAQWGSRIQVVVTSSVDLYELVVRGQFPADLYYRLNVVMLTNDPPAPAAGAAP